MTKGLPAHDSLPQTLKDAAIASQRLYAACSLSNKDTLSATSASREAYELCEQIFYQCVLTFEIVEFLVDVDYQNQGIGTKLLTKLESSLKQDFDFVLLLMAKDTIAESFYLKRNYQKDYKLAMLRHKL